MKQPSWVERLPAGWRPHRLRHVADISNSNVDKKSYDDGHPVRLCNYTDVYYNDFITDDMELMAATASGQEIRRFQLRPGDVIITKDSESWDDIAVPACVAEELTNVVCGYHLSLFRPSKGRIDGRFLLRALQAQGIREQFWTAANGVTRFGLGQQGMKDALLPVPPLATQKAIADFLDRKTAAIDALIEKKQKLLDLLAEKRAALINQAVTKGLDPNVPMKDSGIPPLGTVPQHWKVVRNKVLVREVVDLSQTGDEELLTVSHITGVTRRSEKDVTMFLAATNVGYKKVHPGDLVINTMWAWMGALGTSADTGIVSPAYGVYRLDRQEMEPRYFDLLYRTPQYVVEMTRYSKGVWSSRLRLYPESFLGLLVPVPPLTEQRRILEVIEQEVGSFPATMQRLSDSISRLQEYRQALITAAVTGQLDIGEEDAL